MICALSAPSVRRVKACAGAIVKEREGRTVRLSLPQRLAARAAAGQFTFEMAIDERTASRPDAQRSIRTRATGSGWPATSLRIR